MGTEDMQPLMKTVIAAIILVSLYTEVRTEPKSDDLHLHLHLDEMGQGQSIKERGNDTLENSKLKRGSKKGGDYSFGGLADGLSDGFNGFGDGFKDIGGGFGGEKDECRATGGSIKRGKSKKCVFPFKYQRKQHSKCLPYKGRFWCSLEKEYKRQWGYCDEDVCPITTECTTIDTSGRDRTAKCSFPFTYAGVEYDYCKPCVIGCKLGQYWCAISPDYEDDGLWLLCNKKTCPLEKPDDTTDWDLSPCQRRKKGSTSKTDPPVSATSSPGSTSKTDPPVSPTSSPDGKCLKDKECDVCADIPGSVSTNMVNGKIINSWCCEGCPASPDVLEDCEGFRNSCKVQCQEKDTGADLGDMCDWTKNYPWIG